MISAKAPLQSLSHHAPSFSSRARRLFFSCAVGALSRVCRAPLLRRRLLLQRLLRPLSLLLVGLRRSRVGLDTRQCGAISTAFAAARKASMQTMLSSGGGNADVRGLKNRWRYACIAYDSSTPDSAATSVCLCVCYPHHVRGHTLYRLFSQDYQRPRGRDVVAALLVVVGYQFFAAV